MHAVALPHDQIWTKDRSNSSGTLGHSRQPSRAGWHGSEQRLYIKTAVVAACHPHQLEPRACRAASLTAGDEHEVSGVLEGGTGSCWSLVSVRTIRTDGHLAATRGPLLVTIRGFYLTGIRKRLLHSRAVGKS